MQIYTNTQTNEVVEAMRFNHETKDYALVFVTCYKEPGFDEKFFPTLIIDNMFKVEIGDWIIKDVDGEFYALMDDTFSERFVIKDANSVDTKEDIQ